MSSRTCNYGWRFVLVLGLTAALCRAAESKDAATQPAPANSTSAPQPDPAKAPDPTTPQPRPKLSAQITGQIASAVPIWNPPPAQPAAPAPAPPPVPGEVRMAPFAVKESQLPRIESLNWMTPKAQDTQMVNQYITPFDRYFLNRFTLPIVGISKEARARLMYEEDKRLQDIHWINDEVEQTKLLDPEEAKELLKIRNNTFVRPGQW